MNRSCTSSGEYLLLSVAPPNPNRDPPPIVRRLNNGIAALRTRIGGDILFHCGGTTISAIPPILMTVLSVNIEVLRMYFSTSVPLSESS